jgi:hypothetical protein
MEQAHFAYERVDPTESRAVLGEFGRVEIQASRTYVAVRVVTTSSETVTTG